MADNLSGSIMEKVERRSGQAFEEWLRSRPVVLMISLVPATQPPEVLQTLLREAFENGSRVGVMVVMSTLADHVTKADRR
jgi:hypothetical protein